MKDLKIEAAEVEVGKTYPLYGMVTEILNETLGEIRIVINHNTVLTTMIQDAEKFEILKKRSFEPGIFISKITHITPEKIFGDCQTIVFGKAADWTENIQ